MYYLSCHSNGRDIAVDSDGYYYYASERHKRIETKSINVIRFHQKMVMMRHELETDVHKM